MSKKKVLISSYLLITFVLVSSGEPLVAQMCPRGPWAIGPLLMSDLVCWMQVVSSHHKTPDQCLMNIEQLDTCVSIQQF